MHKIYTYIIANLLCLTISSTGLGQSFNSKAEVRNMFDSNTKNLWINYLSGTLHDGYIVDMIIGTDGKTCKGLYTLRSSKTVFTFEGDEVNQQLQLIEQDIDGRHTGFLVGKYDGQQFSGLWMSRDKKRNYPLNLKFVNAFNDFQPIAFKYSNWEQFFSNKINGKDVQVNVKREGDIISYGIKEDSILHKDATVIEQHDRIYNLNIQHPSSSFNGRTITIDTADMTKAVIASLDESGYENAIILKSDRRMIFQNTMYADQICMLKCQRPSVGHQGFDRWMDNQCKRWLDKKTSELSQSTIRKLSLADKWTQSANAWVEVTLFMDNMISGAIYFQSSWANGTDMVPFTYDISAGREINIKDIFMPAFDLKSMLTAKVDTFKSFEKGSNEKMQWIKEQSFDKVMLSPDGLILRSNFSTIFGESEIQVPYSEIADKIKYKALLKDLLLK